MELAIQRGVPLYNRGHADACAAIYEVATMALIQMEEALPADQRRRLMDTLRQSRRTHDMSDRAWTLRRGLDETMERMSWRMGS
jgi:hypothetical protein